MTRHKKRVSTVLASGVAAATLLFWGAAPAAAQEPPASRDFDGDGFADLAIGAPFDDVGGKAGAGVVIVLYGSSSGLGADRSQLWHQNKLPGPDGEKAEPNDNFGFALATGDFDGNGFGDLAIGVPGEDVGGHIDAGVVQVLYGSEDGLTDAGATALKPGNLFDHYQAGIALAAVDQWSATGFPGSDGVSDLAVGLPGFGGVEVHRGKAGVGVVTDQALRQCAGGAPSTNRCGAALAAGQLDDGPVEELVIGAPNATRDGISEAGAISIISNTINITFDEDDVGLDEIQEGAHFGASVLVADFTGDGFEEIIAGAPDYDVDVSGSPVRDAGHIVEVVASSSGSGPGFAIAFHEGSDAPDDPEIDDAFGTSLAAGNFGRDPDVDLAVGAPGEHVGSHQGAGMVFILFGDDTKQTWHQDIPSVPDTTHAGDRFGSSLFAGNFGQGGRMDLAIGIPRDIVGSVSRAGAVEVLYGTSTGLSAASDQRWTQDSTGIPEAAQTNDRFGSSVR